MGRSCSVLFRTARQTLIGSNYYEKSSKSRMMGTHDHAFTDFVSREKIAESSWCRSMSGSSRIASAFGRPGQASAEINTSMQTIS